MPPEPLIPPPPDGPPFRYYDCGLFASDGTTHVLTDCSYSNGNAIDVGTVLDMNGPEQGLCMERCQ